MIEKPIHSRRFKRSIFASRLPSPALIAAGLLFIVLVGATLSTPHKISVAAHESTAAIVAETMKIAPADAIGSGGSWSPLTGDGSNRHRTSRRSDARWLFVAWNPNRPAIRFGE
jgi:hypothetical protein